MATKTCRCKTLCFPISSPCLLKRIRISIPTCICQQKTPTHKVNFLSSKQTIVKVRVQSDSDEGAARCKTLLHDASARRQWQRISLTKNGKRWKLLLLGFISLGGDAGEDCAHVVLGGRVLEGGGGGGQACWRINPCTVGNDHGCRRKEEECGCQPET